MNKRLECIGVCLIAGFVGLLGACETHEDEGATTSTPSTVLKVDAAQNKSTSMVGKEMASKACEILTPALVAQIFSVAEANLRQDKIMGCIYSAKTDGNELSARLSMLKIHETEAMAVTFFENATRSMSRDEAVQTMQGMTVEAKKREEIDTDIKKKAVDDMGSLISSTVSEDGIQYEPVPGIGDDARVNTSEGSIWVRKGSVTFLVAAYHGPKRPAPNLAGVAIKDMPKAAMQASNDWTKKTVPQRRADAIKVAQAVIEALPR